MPEIINTANICTLKTGSTTEKTTRLSRANKVLNEEQVRKDVTTRDQVVLALFKEISSRQDYVKVKAFLIAVIDHEFELLPQQRKDVLNYLLSAF